MPRQKPPTIFDPGAKNESFSAATQKPSQCRSLALKLGHFREPTQQSNQFHPTLELSQVRSPTLKSSQFGPSTQIASPFSCSH